MKPENTVYRLFTKIRSQYTTTASKS